MRLASVVLAGLLVACQAPTAPSTPSAPSAPSLATTSNPTGWPFSIVCGETSIKDRECLFQVFHQGVTLSSVSFTFGDGQSAAGQPDSVRHTYAAYGVYNTSFTATRSDGFVYGGTMTLTVNPMPLYIAKDCRRNQYGRNTCRFMADSTQPLTNVAWNYGDGLTGTGNPTIHHYTTKSDYVVYTVHVTALDSTSTARSGDLSIIIAKPGSY